MIKIEEYNDNIITLAGGETKSFMYQIAETRFHTTVGFVSDYKIGCGEILKLFIGKNLYSSAQSIHINNVRRRKINIDEPYLGQFLKTETINSNNIDTLLNFVVEYDAYDYGCGQITNLFLRIPNKDVNKNINVGFNINGSVSTIYSTPLNKEPTQSNNSDYLYNYANRDVLKWANEYKSTGDVSEEFINKLIELFGNKTIIDIKDSQLHEPYRTKFDEKYKEVKNDNKLKLGMFDL